MKQNFYGISFWSALFCYNGEAYKYAEVDQMFTDSLLVMLEVIYGTFHLWSRFGHHWVTVSVI